MRVLSIDRVMGPLSFALYVALLATLGCSGSTERAGDAGATDAATASGSDARSDVQTAASDGHTRSDGAPDDATAASACPDQPPENAATCAEVDLECLYERCDTRGLVRASCTPASGEGNIPQRWAVTVQDCSSRACLGTTCGAGTVCTANQGGTVSVVCRPHTCGDGPLTCGCVCGGLPCTPGDTTPTGAGVLFTCVTCAECP